MRRVIFLDTETTGLHPGINSVLQLSIVNYQGETIYNKFFKPTRETEWHEAEEIHKISPVMVKDKKSILEHKKEIEEILSNVDVIVAYNGDYDIGMLKGDGIEIPKRIKMIDVMQDFAPIYGEVSAYGRYKWQKLTTCSKYYGYVFDDKAHDALEDTIATRYCFLKMQEQGIYQKGVWE